MRLRPDRLLVACRSDRHVLMEVKDRKGTLTSAQVDFHETWRGTIHIVRSVKQALAVVGVR